MLPKTVRRVLLVDDSKTVLTIHSSILEEGGFECHTAESGAEALELLMRESFDLIVTDLNMPKMDGYELARRARAAKPDTPILMVSTEAEQVDMSRAMDAGVDVYIVKPVEPEAFVDRCRLMAG